MGACVKFFEDYCPLPSGQIRQLRWLWVQDNGLYTHTCTCALTPAALQRAHAAGQICQLCVGCGGGAACGARGSFDPYRGSDGICHQPRPLNNNGVRQLNGQGDVGVLLLSYYVCLLFVRVYVCVCIEGQCLWGLRVL